MSASTDILQKLLQSGNSIDPNQKVDASPYMPKYSGTPDQEAQNQVDLQYNAQQRAIQQQVDAANKATQTGVQQQQDYGKIVDPRLANVFSALGNSLTQDRADTQGNYATALDRIRGYYDKASQSNQQVNSDVLSRITGQAQQLGLQNALPDSTAGINKDFAFAQQQGNQAKADKSANLDTLATQIFGLDTGRISSAANEGAQTRANAQRDILQSIADLQNSNQAEQSGYRSQLSGLGQDKALALKDAIAKITNQRSQDEISGHKNALDEFLQRSNLGLSQQNQQGSLAQFLAGQEQNQKQFDISQAFNEKQLASQNANEAANRSASSAKASDPLAEMLKMAQIQNLQSEVDNRGKTKLTGQAALESFLSSPNKAWGKTAGKKFSSVVDGIITTAVSNAANQLPGMPKKDPYQLAVALKRNHPTMNQGALQSAIDAFFKGLSK